MAEDRKVALNALWLLAIVALILECSAASQDVLPHPCDAVNCPPMSDMVCPEDSSVRETLSPIALLHASTAPPPPPEVYNSSEIADDLYVQCCLSKKCHCKTCHIPDCHGEGEVVVELLPESMDTPGHCCGQYECQREPNCTAVRDTEHYWLTACQRCKCYSGGRICHQICDEAVAGKKPTAICNSKNLNTFFEHGDSWRDGCYECECVNGEEKCVMPFCKSVNCAQHRQVMLKDSCCPVCWPEGARMPHGDADPKLEEEPELPAVLQRDYDDEDDEDDVTHSAAHEVEPLAPLPHPSNDYADNEIDTLPNVKFDDDAVTTATSTASNQPQASSTTTKAPISVDAGAEGPVGSTAAPATLSGCGAAGAARQDTPATYQVYPEVVEVVRQMHHNDLLYITIGALAVLVVVLVAWNIHLRAKQRSYRPVSHFDDNFNKMACNIKKTNDYV